MHMHTHTHPQTHTHTAHTHPTKANNDDPDFINHHTNYDRATVTQKQACQLLPVHISRGNGFQSTKFQADRILWLSPCLNEALKVPVVSPLATTTPDRQLNFTAVKKDNPGQKMCLALFLALGDQVIHTTMFCGLHPADTTMADIKIYSS